MREFVSFVKENVAGQGIIQVVTPPKPEKAKFLSGTLDDPNWFPPPPPELLVIIIDSFGLFRLNFDCHFLCFSTFFSTRNPFDEENFLRNPLGQQKCFAEPQSLLLTGPGAYLTGFIVSFKFRGTPGGCSRNTRVPRNPG
jgi:hypothetical protein